MVANLHFQLRWYNQITLKNIYLDNRKIVKSFLRKNKETRQYETQKKFYNKHEQQTLLEEVYIELGEAIFHLEYY